MILIWRDHTPPGNLTYGALDTYMDLVENFRPAGCQTFPGDFPETTLQIKSPGEPTDFFFAGPMFMASTALCDLFRDFGVNAEIFPVRTKYRGRPYSKKEFCYVNIVDAVECFDFEHSKYTMTEFGADAVETLVLKDSAADGHHLFRIGQISTNTFNRMAVCDIIRCASEELATAIIREKFTGVVFDTPEFFRSRPQGYVPWQPPR